ncbi:hypothetical protein P692DRAFT_20878403 [Suillus brevipes Sb2]|nr:hypothetical protein P692DRAFT_20878403 [Suillus brevipes Sb2]
MRTAEDLLWSVSDSIQAKRKLPTIEDANSRIWAMPVRFSVLVAVLITPFISQVDLHSSILNELLLIQSRGTVVFPQRNGTSCDSSFLSIEEHMQSVVLLDMEASN